MKIVVLDSATLNPGDNPWDDVAALGDLTTYERTPPELAVERARDAEIVLTNKTLVDAAAIAALPKLRFIAVLATGYNVVDVAAAQARGIPVSNVPEYGTAGVAQHVFALLLELCHKVGEHDAAVHAGEWSRALDFCFWKQTPIELAGLTMGIVGFGRIGRHVGTIAHAFGMAILASARRRHDAPIYPAFEWAETPEIFARADVISLHCPLDAGNARFVNRALLERAKPSALLINTARGGLVDENDLAAALNDGVIAGAAVDVVSAEPMHPDNPLLRARNCILTPHIAWASLAARRRLMATTVENIRAFLAGAPIHRVA